jgi:hypothetical protein
VKLTGFYLYIRFYFFKHTIWITFILVRVDQHMCEFLFACENIGCLDLNQKKHETFKNSSISTKMQELGEIDLTV